MINSRVLTSSEQLASQYTADNKTLTPRSGTPLGDLVGSLAMMDPKSDDVMSQIVNAAFPMNKGMVDKHTYLKDGMVGQLEEMLNNIINYSRNYINVNIREIMEGVEKIKTEHETDSISGGICVKPIGLHNLITSEVLEVYLDKTVGNGSLSRISSATKLRLWNTVEPAQIKSTMRTASESFNKEIDSLLDIFYTGSSIKIIDFEDMATASRGSDELFERNDDVVAYLFLRGVYEGRHPTVSFEDLSSEDKLSIRNLINFWGRQVINRTEAASRMLKTGNVILSADASKSVIRVLKSPYMKWLSEGGSSDALIGYWLSTGKSSTARNTDIALANKSDFEERFTRHRSVVASTIQLKVNSVSERYIVERVVEVIKRDIEDTQERAEMIAKANSFYSKMKISNFDSIDDYCRFMVCKTVGKDTDSLDILNTITGYLKENKDASMDEAVLVAISQRLVEVIFGQIEVLDSSVDLANSFDV